MSAFDRIGNGVLKAKTLGLPCRGRGDDLFTRMEWMLKLLEESPGNTKMLLMSPFDLSAYNKTYFAKIRFASAEQAQRWMDLEKKLKGHLVELKASPALPKNWVIAVYEE